MDLHIEIEIGNDSEKHTPKKFSLFQGIEGLDKTVPQEGLFGVCSTKFFFLVFPYGHYILIKAFEGVRD